MIANGSGTDGARGGASAAPTLSPGSPAWYAALFADTAQRPLIDALCGVWFEVRGVALRAREPPVARLRLAWWREDIALLAQGVPRHPHAQRLQPLLPDRQRAVALLHELVDGVGQELDNTTPENADELRLYAFRCAGAPLVLMAEALGAAPPVALEVGKRVGHAVHCAELLANVGPDLARGRLRVPLPRDHGAAITAPVRTLSQLQPSLDTLAASAQDAIASALIALRGREAAPLRFHRVLLALHEALLRRARASGATDAAVTLPAWRRLWIAWRAARLSIQETSS